MKLLVAVPTVDYVSAEFMKCLCGLIKKLASDGVDFDYQIIAGTLVYWARNRLANVQSTTDSPTSCGWTLT